MEFCVFIQLSAASFFSEFSRVLWSAGPPQHNGCIVPDRGPRTAGMAAVKESPPSLSLSHPPVGSVGKLGSVWESGIYIYISGDARQNWTLVLIIER